jgi:hypothetical protein
MDHAEIVQFTLAFLEREKELIERIIHPLVIVILSACSEFVDKKTLLEQYEALVVAIDEVVDNGYEHHPFQNPMGLQRNPSIWNYLNIRVVFSMNVDFPFQNTIG